jgi:NAD(P)-dependent dehydrogenase (short-subunit alcohol dehydrogenase family)
MDSKTIVFVTGANKGIGYAIVQSLLESDKSYHVFLGSRSVKRGEAAAEKLRKDTASSPNTVEVVQLDIADDASIEKAYETVQTKAGRLDVLVNNAGTHSSFLLNSYSCSRPIPDKHQASKRILTLFVAKSGSVRASQSPITSTWLAPTS